MARKRSKARSRRTSSKLRNNRSSKRKPARPALENLPEIPSELLERASRKDCDGVG